MTNELLTQRRKLLKKRFRTSMIQLYAVWIITAFNCVAELILPQLVLPVSFYLPQFFAYYANFSSTAENSRTLIYFLTVLSFAVLILLVFSLIFARKNYKLMNIVTATASIDMIMLIYIGISGTLISGFQAFFIINIFAHVWMLYLSATAYRASEGLEVLPDSAE
ncbi:MAG: hypothetical protein E7633_01765 [Ruminococcaceae bacterium]|nr:hypothetical protein [Oscillospiraceae bacterium]